VVVVQEVDAFLIKQSVDTLPGVGWSLTEKLKSLGISNVAELRSFEKSRLQAELGPRTALDVWEYAWGIDHRNVRGFCLLVLPTALGKGAMLLGADPEKGFFPFCCGHLHGHHGQFYGSSFAAYQMARKINSCRPIHTSYTFRQREASSNISCQTRTGIDDGLHFVGSCQIV
jgi:hypothetical protein